MADQSTTLEILLKAKDEATEQIKGAGETLGSLGKYGEIAGIGIAAVGTAAVAAGALIFKAGMDASAAFKTISTNTNISADEMEKMKKVAYDLQATEDDSLGSITQAMLVMRREMGLSTDQIGTMAKGFMDYAKVTGQEAAPATEAMNTVMRAWNLQASDLSRVMDDLVAVNHATGASITGMQSALAGQVGQLKALGFTVDESVALYGKFKQAGLEAGDASMALNNALKKIKSPEEFQTMIDKIKAIPDPLAQAQAAMELFGARGGARLVQAIKDGSFSLDQLDASLKGTQGVVGQTADKIDSGLGAQLDILKNKFTVIAEQMGISFPGMAAKLVAAVNNAFPSMQQLQDGLGKLQSTFTNAMAEFDKRTGIITQVKNAFADVWKQISVELMPALADLWKALQPLMPVFEALAKILAVVLVVALKLVIEALKLGIQLFIDILTGVTNFTTFILNQFKPAIDIGRDVLNSLVGPIQTIISTFDAMAKAAENAINWARSAASSAGNAVSNAVSSVMPKFASGGIVSASPGGTAVIVGEGGEDEAIIPTSRLSQLISGGGRSGGMNVSIMEGANVNISNGMDARALAQTIAQQLARSLQATRSGLASSI